MRATGRAQPYAVKAKTTDMADDWLGGRCPDYFSRNPFLMLLWKVKNLIVLAIGSQLWQPGWIPTCEQDTWTNYLEIGFSATSKQPAHYKEASLWWWPTSDNPVKKRTKKDLKITTGRIGRKPHSRPLRANHKGPEHGLKMAIVSMQSCEYCKDGADKLLWTQL